MACHLQTLTSIIHSDIKSKEGEMQPLAQGSNCCINQLHLQPYVAKSWCTMYPCAPENLQAAN